MHIVLMFIVGVIVVALVAALLYCIGRLLHHFFPDAIYLGKEVGDEIMSAVFLLIFCVLSVVACLLIGWGVLEFAKLVIK